MSGPQSSNKSLFLAALEMESDAERAAFLEEACGDNRQLREEIESLLEAHRNPADLVKKMDEFQATVDQPISEKPGTQIGPYKLLQQLGVGGMGVVYLAEQKEPVKRRVALKIIKPGMDTRQVIARFEAERQALAMMDHPNIAKVLDAGATESGRPYFVMELVKGVPVTKYCDEQHLTPKERLELFVPVCQAVQHAHQKGVIHRDLKPSNILVALYDGKAVPKIIDFGVAKATTQTLTEKTMFTQVGQVVGTLEYMSPEQAQVNQLDVDTRSDIYSLGVVLYELLTGETPFDRERLRSAAFDELLRIIREEEPSKPSTKVSSSLSLPSIAANRRMEPAKLGNMIRGELDWIVLKAMEKDRARRYETASKFAEDVQHYLNDEPVVACPPSRAYRLRKFARRHRVGFSVTTLVSLSLIAGMSLALWQAREARQATARATRENNRTQETLRLALRTLDEVYSAVTHKQNSNATLDDSVKSPARKAMRRFYEELVLLHPGDAQLMQQRASGYMRLGRLCRELGDPTRAEAAYQSAAELYQELAASEPSEVENHFQLGRCFSEIAHVLELRGRADESLAEHTRAVLALANVAARAPDNPEYTTAWAHALATRGVFRLYTLGQSNESAEDFRMAFQTQAPIVAAYPDRPWYRYVLGFAYHDYACSVSRQRRFDEADHYFRLALEEKERVVQQAPADALYRWQHALTYQCWARSEANAGKWEVAAITCQRSNELHEAVTTDFPNIPVYRFSYVSSLDTAADAAARSDDWLAVSQHLCHAFEQAQQMVAQSDKEVRFCTSWVRAGRRYADLLMTKGRYDEAAESYGKILGRLGDFVTRSPANAVYRDAYVTGVLNRIALLARECRNDEAANLHHQAIGVLRGAIANLSDKHQYGNEVRAQAVRDLAWMISATPIEALRDPAEALRLAQEAVRLHPDGETWNALGLACYRAGKLPEAIDTLETALNVMEERAYGYNAFPLAMIHHRLGNEDKARYWYESGVGKMDEYFFPDSGQILLRWEAAQVLGVDATEEIMPQSKGRGDAESYEADQ